MLEKDSKAGLREKWDELYKELKSEWRTMWRERFDDSVAAEGVAVQDYSLLSTGRGTIVVATRKYRAPDFSEIVKRQRKLLGIDADGGCANPFVGGWTKFANRTLKVQPRFRSRRAPEIPCADEKAPMQQKKKGGRGWIHRF
jgi:hypothetical protein